MNYKVGRDYIRWKVDGGKRLLFSRTFHVVDGRDDVMYSQGCTIQDSGLVLNDQRRSWPVSRGSGLELEIASLTFCTLNHNYVCLLQNNDALLLNNDVACFVEQKEIPQRAEIIPPPALRR